MEMDSLMPPAVLPPRKSLQYELNGRVSLPLSRYEHFGERKMSFPLLGIEP